MVFVTTLFLLVILAIIGRKAIRIVQPYERALIERMGKYQRTTDPGLVIIIPFIDTIRRVDVREKVVDISSVDTVTRDDVPVIVDASVHYHITDPKAATYIVDPISTTLASLAKSALKGIMNELELDEILGSREGVRTHLQQILEKGTVTWGVAITHVELATQRQR